MKTILKFLCAAIIAASFAGCYKQISKEALVPADVKVVALDESALPMDVADLIVTTHIKKASYLISPRTAETPYTFTILIDGNELKESLKGIEVVDSKIAEERGKGIHYTLKKRLRLTNIFTN